MIPDGESSGQLEIWLKDSFRRAGVKLTHQRLEICREVMRSSGHPDAETVFRGVRSRIPTVSLDTVYRTLWLLVDLGLLSTLGLPQDRVRFDSNMRPHHHFVCVMCGATHDFYCEVFDRLSVPAEVIGLGNVKSTHVEAKGLCVRCLEKANTIQSKHS